MSKIKIISAFALAISVFMAGSILIFGLTSRSFVYVYFLFTLIWLGILASYIKTESKTILVFLVVLMAFGITLFAQGGKIYYDKNKEFQTSNPDLIYQIQNLTAVNQHYINYISYLNNEIENININSGVIQNQITRLLIAREQDLANQQSQQNQTASQPRERRERENDD